MADTALTCTQCNTPLEITAATFSVSCTACGQWHLIDRTGTAPVATPFGEAPSTPPTTTASATDDAAVDPQARAVIEELDRLDLAWLRERKQFLVLGWDGGDAAPRLGTSVLLGLGLVALGAAIVHHAAEFASLDGLTGALVIVAGIGLGMHRVQKATGYQQAYQRYQRRRRTTARPVQQPAVPAQPTTTDSAGTECPLSEPPQGDGQG